MDVKTGDNAGGSLLVWYTNYEGCNLRVVTDVAVSEILDVINVGEEYPLFDPSTGIGMEWYPRSAMDMVEDKHRHRASVANTAKELIDEQLSPIGIVKTGFPIHLLEDARAGDIIETDDPTGVRYVEKP